MPYVGDDGRKHVAFCGSACVWSFAGGEFRMMDRDCSLAVHRFANGGSDAAAQVTMTMIAQYLDRMGVSRQLLDLTSTVPFEQGACLTIADAVSFHLIDEPAAPPRDERKLRKALPHRRRHH
jgi:hypothetical protein